MRFRGRIDRVDDVGGAGVRVVDYKTGSSRPYRRDSFEGGRQLQLPIYLLAACGEAGVESGSCGYLFVSGPRWMSEPDRESLAERFGDFSRAVSLILTGITGGDFFPLPTDVATCERYCPYRHVCGAGRDVLAEMKRTDPDLRDLNELRGIR